MKVVERFDSDEKKFYPYNSEEIEEENQEINKFVEVQNPSKTDSPSKKPINFSQSDQFKSIDPTLQQKNNTNNDKHNNESES